MGPGLLQGYRAQTFTTTAALVLKGISALLGEAGCRDREPRPLSPWPPQKAVARHRARTAAETQSPDPFTQNHPQPAHGGCGGKGPGLFVPKTAPALTLTVAHPEEL